MKIIIILVMRDIQNWFLLVQKTVFETFVHHNDYYSMKPGLRAKLMIDFVRGTSNLPKMLVSVVNI